MLVHIVLQIVGIAGGGGSGGDTGGGSGGGGGGGGAAAFLIFTPLFVSGALGGWIRRKHDYKQKRMLFGIVAAMLMFGIIAWGFTQLSTTSNLLFHGFLSLLATVGFVLGYVYDALSLFMPSRKKVELVFKKDMKKKLQNLAKHDSFYEKETFKTMLNELFMTYQKDWQNFDLQHMRSYMSDDFYEFNVYMMNAMQLRKRKNIVHAPIGRRIMLYNLDNEGCKMTVTFRGVLADELVDMRTNDFLYKNNSLLYREIWDVKRDGNRLVLQDIHQDTDEITKYTKSIMEFAKKESMVFRLDMGYLLLPSVGQLFKGGGFFKSNLDNYVIGRFRGILVELYTYQKDKNKLRSKQWTYTIAQTSLPKEYGSIYIKPKSLKETWWKRSLTTPKGYMRISSESKEFNEKYEIYATDMEKATTFELLHPAYMAKLIDTPLDIGIEVVDNMVYMFTANKRPDYSSLYTLLQEAFDEMKM